MFPAYKNVLTNTKVYDNISFARPVSQVVKTPPSHGGDRGSTPLRVTRVMARSRYALRALFFIFTESAFVHSGIFLFPIYRPGPDAIRVRTFSFSINKGARDNAGILFGLRRRRRASTRFSRSGLFSF